jgi:hypothetical protein
MADFIEIKDDEEYVSADRWPAAWSMVEVRLRDGSTTVAWFDANIMDAGDYDFFPVRDGDHATEPDSIADQVVAWRPLG